MLTVIGAGSVGLGIGARTARSGESVRFLVRSPDVAATIEAEGLRLEDPVTGDVRAAPARATSDVREAARLAEGGPFLFCVRTPDLERAAGALARAAPDASVAGAQNDVEGDALLARHFAHVVGVVVRGTYTRYAPNAVRTTGRGRLVVGAYPEGSGRRVYELAATFARAGYDVGVSLRIAQDRWLKLCVNLMSAANALVRRPDHRTREFVALKVGLLEEARAVLRAAGIQARSCDGRDRSLEDEIAHLQASLERGESARTLPLYNQVWAALRHGGPLEADAYHRRILELARRHGAAAPLNTRVLAALERAFRESLGPESVSARELLGRPPDEAPA
jgi:2-dehydropantoate 2-reductase